MAIIFWLSIYGGAHWRHLANTTPPSMCGGNMANYFDHLFMVALCNRADHYIFAL